MCVKYMCLYIIHVQFTHVTHCSYSNICSIDQLHAQRLLEDPNVKEALLDPDIIKLMEILKTDPNQAQRYIDTSHSPLTQYIHIYIHTYILLHNYT